MISACPPPSRNWLHSSRKKREAALDAIKAACEAHINGPLRARLAQICADTCARAGLEAQSIRVEADARDGQTLLLVYPSITPEDAYIAKSVKIESGAKSALDPNSVRTIVPYVDADAVDLDLAVPGITVVDAERTLWDKVVILHGLRRWFEIRGQLRGDGQRILSPLLRPVPPAPIGDRPSGPGKPRAWRGLRCPCPHVLQSPGLRSSHRAGPDILLVPGGRDDRCLAPGLSRHEHHDLRRAAAL